MLASVAAQLQVQRNASRHHQLADQCERAAVHQTLQLVSV